MKTKILIITMLGLLLVGCKSIKDQSTVKEYDYAGTVIDYYTDPDTGVCYLIYDGGFDGGITVRYNADGSIMTKGDLK
jgi:uncharacterized protein YceK